MIEDFSNIKWIGFDVDGTLYPIVPEINERIRNKIAEKILEKKPNLKDISSARNYFEQRYNILHSGSKVLKEVGYENPTKIMDFCQVNANILDLIEPNHMLNNIIQKLQKKYQLYILSSSPEKLTLEKLNKIGINPKLFSVKIYNDTPGCGSKSGGEAYDFILSKINCPAENIIHIGDNLKKDILPAKQRGMKTIAVGSNIPEADYSILNINQLERILL